MKNYHYADGQLYNQEDYLQNQFVTNGVEASLYSVVKQLHFQYQEEHAAVYAAKDFCMQAQSDENRRIGMEFLYVHGFLDELEILIEKNNYSVNPQNKLWGSVYRIVLNRRKYRSSPHDYITEINALTVLDVELNCMKDFLQVYAYFELGQFGMLGEYLDKLTTSINRINEPLLNELFSMRLDELLLTFHWKRNEMIMARKYGYKILKNTQSPRKKIDINNTMALGYLFESYQQAMFHAWEAKKIAHQTKLDHAIAGLNNFTIPFISAYHEMTDGITTTDPAEQAHLALGKGDTKTCVDILNRFESLTSFQQYYLGKATKDAELLRASYNRFIHERSDHFFAKLPLLELKKL